jgi:aminoglycoside phosphotransferase (APT) family kinase protein
VPRAAASSARAEAAGRLAALLHRHSPPAGAPRSLAARKEHQARLDPGLWRAVDPSAGLCGRLERLERALPDHGGRGARPGAERWIHGDLHADQVAPLDGEPGGQPGSFALLDLDALGAGDPLRDLASWLADDVARERSTELLRSAVDDGPFLAGYLRAGGARPEAPALAAAVAAALLRAAAAGLRRLQRGAPGRALELLALAEDLLGVEVAR